MFRAMAYSATAALIIFKMLITNQVHRKIFKMINASKRNVNLQLADTVSLSAWLGCILP
jgi:hypothetical protein